MTAKEAARKVVQRLALSGRSLEVIEARLEEMKLAGALDDQEIQELLVEIRAGKEIVAKSDPVRGWIPAVRILGIVAIVLGTIALRVDTDGFAPTRRWSPHGYGVLAILAGAVLVVKPRWGFEKLK